MPVFACRSQHGRLEGALYGCLLWPVAGYRCEAAPASRPATIEVARQDLGCPAERLLHRTNDGTALMLGEGGLEA